MNDQESHRQPRARSWDARTWILGGVLATCVLAAGTATEDSKTDGFALVDRDSDALDVTYGGRRVARYMHAHDTSTPERLHETYKPYLHVFDAAGENFITKGAGGQYTHHRGIFAGWSRVQCEGESYDLWHMKGVTQVHEKFLARKADAEHATFTSVVSWNDRDGEPLLREERTMTFRPIESPGIVAIDLETRLTARRKLRLDGDPEHAGVQYRPANEVVASETRYVFPQADADPRKDLDYPWVGETYSLRGNRYSVIHMNHPTNPRGTVYSAYRDYGRFGAFFKKDLDPGETLTLRYRFVVQEGELPPKEEIGRRWKAFAAEGEGAPAAE